MRGGASTFSWPLHVLPKWKQTGIVLRPCYCPDAHRLSLFIDPSLNCGLTQLCPFSAVSLLMIATIDTAPRSNGWPLFLQHLYMLLLLAVS